MWMKDLPFEAAAPGDKRARDFVAAFLRASSRALDGLAQRLSLIEAAPSPERVLEFHADAGAPEGALYINGRLVGHVLGVTRL